MLYVYNLDTYVFVLKTHMIIRDDLEIRSREDGCCDQLFCKHDIFLKDFCS